MSTWESALEGRVELARYDDNKVLLFAVWLHQGIDDIELLANDALTDGPDDKKCDLVYVNTENGKVIIAQGYWSKDNTKPQAPSNKASDLNTAASWLLSSNLREIPGGLRSAAEQLHDALNNDEVRSIEFWYVHNLPESENVRHELEKVERTAESLIKRYYSGSQVDWISATEVGQSTLETWYRGTQAPILVTEKYRFQIHGGFYSKGNNWEAYSTSVPAKWLNDLFHEHGKNLFSANVRDYLGSRQSDKNINHNIKETAINNPDMFWVYNNGITALVNDFDHVHNDDDEALEISGIAIVNGAQTTGALGSIEGSELLEVFVPARFVKCSDVPTIQEIIRYNNSQNKIEAPDFRSNDPIQTRLRSEFDALEGVSYSGGRRGGFLDAMPRSRSLISSYSVGQALMAFHGEPATAYNKRSHIWQSDALYSKVFNENTTASHIIFAYSLLKAVDNAKAHLKYISEDDRTSHQNRQWEVLSQRGATFLLTAAISNSLETILQKAIHNKFSLHFKENLTIPDATEKWKPILNVALPLINTLSPALTGGNLTNKDKVTQAISDFVDMLEAVRDPNAEAFSKFSKDVN